MALPARAISLIDKLASVLPHGHRFGVHHLSTPPTKTDALYSAPPDTRPDKTYLESHFLVISIDPSSTTTQRPQLEDPFSSPAAATSPKPQAVLIFAIEVLIYTTAYTTTIFISKADSTGFLSLLKLLKGTPSPIREVSATFVEYLVAHRRRKNILTVATLFARSQGQYLFPGSVENSGKHVLDDRGLVKWWCRVLNSVLEGQEDPERRDGEQWASVKGYLIVPGLDNYEMRAFLPRTSRALKSWELGHPSERISHYTREYDWVPPRCLVPYYPDDPKSRFRDELDDEAGRLKSTTGAWRSVRNIDEFWDVMAFRQECSSGRLTGFLWVVFDPADSLLEHQEPTPANSQLPTPTTSFQASSLQEPPSTPPRQRQALASTPRSAPIRFATTPLSTKSTTSNAQAIEAKRKPKKLTGRIVPRKPHIKTEQRNYLLERPTTTAYYHWPPEGRGTMIVSDTDYKRSTELLLHLDFQALEKATAATRRWIKEVGGGRRWDIEIVGKRMLTDAQESSRPANGAAVNNLSGLVKRKRPVDAVPAAEAADSEKVVEQAPKVNSLSASLVRKKPKVAPERL
jgi:regulator of Ty1 transposition protein 109